MKNVKDKIHPKIGYLNSSENVLEQIRAMSNRVSISVDRHLWNNIYGMMMYEKCQK